MNVWLAIMKVEGDAGIISWPEIVAKEDSGVMDILLVGTAVVGEGVARG